MNVTQRDFDEVMAHVRACGSEEITPELKAMTEKLGELFVKSKYKLEMVGQLVTICMADSIKREKIDQLDLLSLTASMGVMAGLAVGYLVHQREQGKELGIEVGESNV